MTLSTYVYMDGASEAELQSMFLAMRRIASIPAEWPFTVLEDGAWLHEHGCPTATARVDFFPDEGEPDEPSPARLVWDTPYGYTSPSGEDCFALHRRFLAELAESLPPFIDIGRVSYIDEWSDDLNPKPLEGYQP